MRTPSVNSNSRSCGGRPVSAKIAAISFSISKGVLNWTADTLIAINGTTISASIANEFTEAVGDLYTSSLIALGVLLFLITFTVIAAARFMLLRLDRQGLSSV